MVGLDFIWELYQNSGPALQIIIILGLAYVWKHDIQPRINDLETTQERRDDRWDDQELNAQERAMLIDNAHERVDDIEVITDRLKKRVRGIEQAYACEHGERPNPGISGLHEGQEGSD